MCPFNGYDIDNYIAEKSPVTFLYFILALRLAEIRSNGSPNVSVSSVGRKFQVFLGFSRRGFRASELAVMIWSLWWCFAGVLVLVGSVGDFVRWWCRGDFMGWSVVKSREVFAVDVFFVQTYGIVLLQSVVEEFCNEL